MASYFSPAYDKFTPNTWDAVNNIAIPQGVFKKKTRNFPVDSVNCASLPRQLGIKIS